MAMTSQQSISLSFFELLPQDFEFKVYRQPFMTKDRREDHPGFVKYALPRDARPNSREEDYPPFWLRFDHVENLEEFLCDSRTNPYLTCEYLYRLLLHQCKSNLRPNVDFLPSKSRFRHRKIEFVLESRREGKQVVWLEPYWLKVQQKLGFLLDFAFRAHDEYRTSIEARKLSLSLDKYGRTNRNVYSDKYDKITEFVSRFGESQ